MKAPSGAYSRLGQPGTPLSVVVAEPFVVALVPIQGGHMGCPRPELPGGRTAQYAGRL